MYDICALCCQTVLTDGLHLGCSADLSGFADLAEYTIEYLSSLGWYKLHCHDTVCHIQMPTR